jgi:putative transposase
MARIARAVVPELPHHVIQRGNRRQQTFFRTDDYLLYTNLMSACCRKFGVDIWAYCLMPNHAHLIAVPRTPDSLRRAIGEAHRQYTLEINRREKWTGYLWQGRFASFPMDDRHTAAAARYVELNPVRAGLAGRAEEYAWSSARAHLLGVDDVLVSVAPLLSRIGDWRAFLGEGAGPDAFAQFRRHANTGRPLGTSEFVDDVERILGRALKPRKRGRRPTIGEGPTSA